MRSLPSAWKPKPKAIEEAKDLSTMTLEDLTGSLMTYELGLQEEQDDENVRRERGIALKSQGEEEVSESESEDEMSMFQKQFGKMYRHFKSNRNKQDLVVEAPAVHRLPRQYSHLPIGGYK
ncbi:unnamed protein product [Cuscuta epithymum]|uniref:Uncharacterized protein n=1 Tax=Cuscuta epithymum TaxID=186058 RepID=A0AAV0GD39_9ASTE|nr:unnamed protein product [Cuscuta epithymum]